MHHLNDGVIIYYWFKIGSYYCRFYPVAPEPYFMLTKQDSIDVHISHLVFVLPFIPNITPYNFENKIKTYLTFS